jgi:hypothetical protein
VATTAYAAYLAKHLLTSNSVEPEMMGCVRHEREIAEGKVLGAAQALRKDVEDAIGYASKYTLDSVYSVGVNAANLASLLSKFTTVDCYRAVAVHVLGMLAELEAMSADCAASSVLTIAQRKEAGEHLQFSRQQIQIWKGISTRRDAEAKAREDEELVAKGVKTQGQVTFEKIDRTAVRLIEGFMLLALTYPIWASLWRLLAGQ